jgi:mono/diheme cytochrome c family protein
MRGHELGHFQIEQLRACGNLLGKEVCTGWIQRKQDKGDSMKLAWKTGLVLLIVISLSVFATAQNGDAIKGGPLYASKCAVCHGAKGEGKPALKTGPLTTTEIKAKTDAALGKVILEGKGTMKPIKVSNTEAADIVAFMRTLK